jgi:hypothetical protein
MMYGNSNNKIEIEKVHNGYLVTIILPGNHRDVTTEVLDKFIPMIEQMKNQIEGEDWKNKMQDEIDSSINVIKPPPLRQFIAKNWKEVLNIINAENF